MILFKMTQIDPLKLRNVSLNNDIYTLYWAGLNKDCWDKLHEEYPEIELTLTSENKRTIKFYFFVFIITVFFTLSLILYQVFTTEIEVICPIQITVLRILLVMLVQSHLTGEFRESLAKWKYSRENPEKFIEPWTADLIAALQFFVAVASYATLLLFICTETAPLDLIMDFTGIVVFVDLDDWIGEKICSTEPNLDTDKIAYYGKEKINEKMPIHMKLSKLQYYTDIVEDLNESAFNWILALFGNGRLIFACFPLLVLVVERLFIAYHPYVAIPNLK